LLGIVACGLQTTEPEAGSSSSSFLSSSSAPPPQPAALAAQWIYPLPTGNDLLAVRYLENEFWAMGAQGTLLSSPNGIDWAVRSLGGSGSDYDNIQDLAYGQGLYVAVGYAGSLRVSVDKDHWTLQAPPVPNRTLRAIAYGQNRFVAVGDAGTILVSADAQTWTASAPTTVGLTDIAYRHGQFLAVGESGTLLVSADGTRWQQRALPATGEIYAIVEAGDSTLLLSDPILWTTDGATWHSEPQEDHYFISQACYAEGALYYGTYDLILRRRVLGQPSTAIDVNRRHLNGTACAGGRFVAVGGSGDIFTFTNDGQPLYTPPPTGQRVQALTSGNGIVAAIGSEMHWIIRQSAGTWSHDTLPLPNPYYASADAMAYGNGYFLAVGTKGSTLRSTDGANWTALPAQDTSYQFRTLLFAQDRFIAVGAGCVYQSRDGAAWERQCLDGLPDLYSIAYGDSLYVLGSGFGQLFTSRDARTWQSVQTECSSILGLAYGNGVFVGVGGWDKGVYSANGSDWQCTSTGLWANAVAFGAGQFVAVGGTSSTGAAGLVRHSADGLHWFPQESLTGNDLTSVIFDGHAFIAGGLGSSLLSYTPTPYPGSDSEL